MSGLLRALQGQATKGTTCADPAPATPPATSLLLNRVPQILSNFRAGGTGQLSLITYGLNTAGAAARIFTSVQEKAGAAMLRGSIISAWGCKSWSCRCGVAAAVLTLQLLLLLLYRVADAAMQLCGGKRVAGSLADCQCLRPSPLSGTLLNAVLALQIVFYGGGGSTKNAGRRGKKKAT